MEFILCIFYTLIFIFLIFKIPFFKIDGVSLKILASIFIIKILSALAVTFIYTYYYRNNLESDIFKYYSDGNILFQSIKTSPLDYLRMLTGIGSDAPHLNYYYDTMNFWQKPFDYGLFNDNRTMIRFNALASIFSFGYINVHNVFMAFLSFIGLTAIFKTFYPYFLEKKWALIFSVFLIPSVLIWTSGILKEGLLMFAFGMLIYYTYKLIHYKFKLATFIGLVIMIGLLIILKFYILLAAIPGLLSIVIVSKFRKLPQVPVFIIVHAIVIAGFFLFHFVFKNYNLPEIIASKQHDFVNMIDNSGNVGSKIEIPKLEPTFYSFLSNSPAAFINSLFRPHILEVHSLMALPAALENLLIILFMVLSIIFFKKYPLSTFPWFWFSVSFVFILFILCGLTTPVLGALVRYRTPALPFLFIIFITFIDFKKIQHIVKWKK